MVKRFTRRPMLWLPYKPEQPPNPATRGSLDFAGVTLSYRQVYGSEPTWNDLERTLASYSLEQIVDVVCRLSAILYKAPLTMDGQTQWQICQGIFGSDEANQILQTANRIKKEMLRKERGAPPLLAFHEQQTLNLLKAAFLLKNKEHPNTAGSLIGIGKALLMITDLTQGEPGDLLSVGPTHPEYFDRWLSWALANYFFPSGAVGSLALVRSHDLYLIDKPHLATCGSYIDFRAMLRATTGLEPHAFWSAIFALAAHWVALSAEIVSDATMVINKNTYFSKEYTFTDEEVERFFAICATNVDDMKAEVERHYTATSLRPFHFLPFANRPLVAFGDRLYTVSVALLMQKLITGLHYLFLDQRHSSAQRQRYLTYMGEVFEDYAHRILERMFPHGARRYLRLNTLRPCIDGKLCDGLIAYEEAVLLVESKASLFTLEARAGENIASIRGRLEDIYKDGAAQIQATIDLLRQGFHDDQGIIPNQIKRYYPIIVTLEKLPMHPILYGDIRRTLVSQGLLQDGGVQPLQSINIEELEHLKTVLAGGASLKQLIDDKLSRAAEADDSWANYLYRRRDNLKTQPDDYQEDSWMRLSESASRFFEDRKRSSA